MPAFTGIVDGIGVRFIKQVDQGIVISVDPTCAVRLTSEGGEPHALSEQLRPLVGKRVHVSIQIEQPELFEDEDAENAAFEESSEPEAAEA